MSSAPPLSSPPPTSRVATTTPTASGSFVLASLPPPFPAITVLVDPIFGDDLLISYDMLTPTSRHELDTISPSIQRIITETGLKDKTVTSALFDWDPKGNELGLNFVANEKNLGAISVDVREVMGVTVNNVFEADPGALEPVTSSTPSASRSTPRNSSSSTPTGTNSTTSSTSPIALEPPNTGTENNSNTSSKTPPGVIVGAVLGGLIFLILILAGTLWLLRRQRRKREARGPIYHEKGYESDTYAFSPHELPGQGLTQELDPKRGDVAPMPAPELAPERTYVEAGAERGDGDDHSFVVKSANEEAGEVVENVTAVPSVVVQRQRNVEIEWLENEEARLRERKELLRRQQEGIGGSR